MLYRECCCTETPRVLLDERARLSATARERERCRVHVIERTAGVTLEWTSLRVLSACSVRAFVVLAREVVVAAFAQCAAVQESQRRSLRARHCGQTRRRTRHVPQRGPAGRPGSFIEDLEEFHSFRR